LEWTIDIEVAMVQALHESR